MKDFGNYLAGVLKQLKETLCKGSLYTSCEVSCVLMCGGCPVRVLGHLQQPTSNGMKGVREVQLLGHRNVVLSFR